MEERKEMLLKICEMLTRQENWKVSRNLAETSSAAATVCAVSVLPDSVARLAATQTMKTIIKNVADIIKGELTEKKKMKLVIAVDSFFWELLLTDAESMVAFLNETCALKAGILDAIKTFFEKEGYCFC